MAIRDFKTKGKMYAMIFGSEDFPYNIFTSNLYGNFSWLTFMPLWDIDGYLYLYTPQNHMPHPIVPSYMLENIYL